MEFVPIILWKYNEDIFNSIKTSFDVVDVFDFSFDKDEMKKKMQELYYPHKISDNDERIHSKNIKILVLKILDPTYNIFSRKEHNNKPLNKTIIDFKEKLRRKYNYTYFHSADYLNESQHTFRVFNITKYITNTLFININDLRGVVWLKRIKGEYCLKRISETPHYLYLNGEKTQYNKYVKDVDRKHNTSDYDALIKSLNPKSLEENINGLSILVTYDNDIDKYIIAEGFHRSSIYLKNNIHYIKCRVNNKIKFNLKNRYVHEHYFSFEETIDELNKHNVRYVIVRGFKKLPLTPDSDLDIICHPDDLDKLKHILLKRLVVGETKEITIDSMKLNYIQFKTTGIPNKDIANTHFHIDIYDNIFFFHKKHICLPNLLDNLFDNRILYMNKIYVPSAEFEYFLLILRICLDLGNLRYKHKNRLLELLPSVKNKHNLFDCLNDTEKALVTSKLKLLSVPVVENYPIIN